MKISVITPVYNRADCIEACMESVSHALNPGFEIEHVVCDDGSTDGSFDIVCRYASTHSNVKALRLEKNSGTNKARNAAIEKATGDWILILDSDDTVARDAFVSIADIMSKHPGFIHYLFSCDDRLENNSYLGDSKVLTFEDFLLGRVFGDFAHLLLRKTVLTEPFDERLRIHEGVFFLRFFRNAGTIFYSSKVTHLRDRSRDDHVTFTMRRTNNRALEERILYDQLFCQYFERELHATKDGREQYINLLKDQYRSAILLGRYDIADEAAEALRLEGIHLPVAEYICRTTHTGPFAWSILKVIMRLRWKLRMMIDKS